MSVVILSGSDKKRYELRRAWWERPLVITIFAGFLLYFLATEGANNNFLIFMLIMAGFYLLSEVLWPRGNFIIVHPDHVDTSRLFLGSKMRKREKHRICYEDIIQVTADDSSGQLTIRFRLGRKLLAKAGITEWRVTLVLRRASDAPELKEVIELGRKLSIERHQLAHQG